MYGPIFIKKIFPYFFIFLIVTTLFANASDLLCDACKKPVIGKYWQIQGKIYCDNCFKKYGPRCKLCGNLLVGEYVFIPYTGDKFCKNCVTSYPNCANCDNPVGAKGVKIDTNRFLCPSCMARAIFTYEQLAPVYKEAVYQLSTLGFTISKPVVNLSIMNRGDLDKYLGQNGVGENGFCESWSSGSGIYAHRIYVLKGLSYEESLTVLCHELAHAWQAENSSLHLDSFYVEGFAEWVAYRVLLKKKYLNHANRLSANSDPVYGGGLRYILYLEEQYGSQWVVEYFKSVKK